KQLRRSFRTVNCCRARSRPEVPDPYCPRCSRRYPTGIRMRFEPGALRMTLTRAFVGSGNDVQAHGTRRLHLIDLGIVLIATAALAGAVALSIAPSSPDSPTRLKVLDDFIAGRSISYTPYPIGYIVFAGLIMRWFGMHGLVVAQGVLFVATVALCYEILRSLALPRPATVGGALLVAIHPNLLTGITKFLDT